MIPASRHLPYMRFMTPRIMACRHHQWVSIIELDGIPYETVDDNILNEAHAALSFYFQRLPSTINWSITTHHRQEAVNFTPTKTGHCFRDALDEAYHAPFLKGGTFKTVFYLTLVFTPETLVKTSAFSSLKRIEQHVMQDTQQRIDECESMLQNTLVQLAPYNARVLENCETMQFLSRIINAHPYTYSEPRDDIASAIPIHRLWFGTDTIHVEGLTLEHHRFAALLSLKAYPKATRIGVLNELLALPFEWIATHSFIPLDKPNALNFIKKQTRRFQSVEDEATTQHDALTDLCEGIASDTMKLGQHHHTLMIMTDKLDVLNEAISKAHALYQHQGLHLVRETLNLQNAFWAQLPGNQAYIKRKSWLTHANFTAMNPLHNTWMGYRETHLGDCVMLTQTRQGHAFYFNLHEPSTMLPKGHTLLIGPSNAGKTVIMTLIDAMMKRFNARSVFIDRNQGVELYVRAMGGTYTTLTDKSRLWNPLQLPDNPMNREFLGDWLGALCTDNEPLTANDKALIKEVIERNYTLPFHERRLSVIEAFFPKTFRGHSALERYYENGLHAHLFDNKTDTFELSDTMGIDLTHWLTSDKPRSALLPINMYLFHRLMQSLDGRLTGLYLDEAWQVLDNPYWLKKLNEYLVTGRKQNLFIVFATQLPDKVAQSPLASALLQNTATQMYLPNPRAEKEDYCERLKLSDNEFHWVKTLTPQSHVCLVKQAHQSTLITMPLHHIKPYIRVLSGTTASVKRCEQLRAQLGDDPQAWLAAFMQDEHHA